jgi:hypothetical protein
MSSHRALAGLVALLSLAMAAPIAAQPVGTAFTYQGRLMDAGSAASGSYDLRFILMDAPFGGAQVGPVVTVNAVTVSNGLFTVTLDFGAVFAGSKRWLEVAVRPGGSTAAYTVLSPRQELTPGPNAVFSSAVPWTGITGKPPGFADDIDNDVLGGLSCANGQIAKWNGTAWACAPDANSGGTVTSVTGGTGLTGGTITSSGTLAVDPTVAQSRVTGACAPASSIRIVNQDGSVVCQPDTTGADWGLAGNAGTNPATNFIGTTDNQPFELRVNNTRAVRVEPPLAAPAGNRGPNVVLGDGGNSVGAGVQGAFVAGGGTSFATPGPNQVTGDFGVVAGGVGNQAAENAMVGGGYFNSASGFSANVSGGENNTASGSYATIGGGQGNSASGFSANVSGGQRSTASGRTATIGGGQGSTASGPQATVGGGDRNIASGEIATVGGGRFNVAGTYATVPGGVGNQAGGQFSFAAGRQAKVRDPAQSGDLDGDEGTFAWADSTAADFASTGPNQFLIRAGGGVAINTASPASGAALTVNGNIRTDTGSTDFGATTRQMVNLWGTAYGIGVQGSTSYFRTGSGFAWFQNGVHSNTQNDPGAGGTRQMRLDSGGNLFVRGTVNPNGADFAEMLPGERGLEPGDVVAIGADGSLVRSTEAYQPSVAGVFSTQPGFLGGAADGEDVSGKVPLAVVGIVPVKASAEAGPIRPGDRLVASATPGHAMRSTKDAPVGTVIGKALSSLESGTGMVRMLVVLQ